MTNGYVTNKPYLGITGGSMSEQMAAQYRYDITEGVFVYSVEAGRRCDKAGLRMGDVITKVGDTEITTMEDLTAVKKQYAAGDTTTFAVDRQGESITVEVTWDSLPADQQTSAQENQQETQQNDSNSYGGGTTNCMTY